MMIPVFLWTVGTGQPVALDRVNAGPPVLEASCIGSTARRSPTISIAADGRVSRRLRDARAEVVGSIGRDELRALSARLDVSRFETLKPLPVVRNIYDATSCSITRTRRTQSHTIRFSPGDATSRASNQRYRAVRQVLDDILKIAARFP